MSKRTLIIDGNFMCKRLLHDYTFKENPAKDRVGYLTDLANHIACEIERIEGFCDNIIMVKDSHSWRKNCNLLPNLKCDENKNIYKIDTEETLKYKANRIQSDDRDWSAIFSTFVEFCECLRDKFGVAFIDVPETEGDDCIWAVSQYLRTKHIKTCVYCTDSDISQLVTPSNVILRRIKSKAAPDGEIVVHPKFWEMYNKSMDTTDPMAIFNYDPTKWSPENDMFKGKSLGNGISICYPPYKVLLMIVMGSGKDNVPEIFTWKNKSQFRHITQKYVDEALSLMGLTYKDITYENLYEEPFIKSLIINLCHVTKQTQFINELDYLYKLAIQNRKMNFLSKTEIPENVQHMLIESIKSQENMKADFSKLRKSTYIIDELRITKDRVFQQLGL